VSGKVLASRGLVREGNEQLGLGRPAHLSRLVARSRGHPAALHIELCAVTYVCTVFEEGNPYGRHAARGRAPLVREHPRSARQRDHRGCLPGGSAAAVHSRDHAAMGSVHHDRSQGPRRACRGRLCAEGRYAGPHLGRGRPPSAACRRVCAQGAPAGRCSRPPDRQVCSHDPG
jgi:hypothetical protein